MVEAAVEEVAATGFDGLTVRNVARRAGVSPATAYTYFASKEHLLTEVFWRRLSALAEPPADRRRSAADRVAAATRDMAMLVADEPELAAAVTTAMLAHDPDVQGAARPDRRRHRRAAGRRRSARRPTPRCCGPSPSPSSARC